MKDKLLELKNNLNKLNQSVGKMENTDYNCMTTENKCIFLNKISDSIKEVMDYTQQFGEYTAQYDLPKDILINVYQEEFELVKEQATIKLKIDSLENPEKGMYKYMTVRYDNETIKITIRLIEYYISLLLLQIDTINTLEEQIIIQDNINENIRSFEKTIFVYKCVLDNYLKRDFEIFDEKLKHSLLKMSNELLQYIEDAEKYFKETLDINLKNFTDKEMVFVEEESDVVLDYILKNKENAINSLHKNGYNDFLYSKYLMNQVRYAAISAKIHIQCFTNFISSDESEKFNIYDKKEGEYDE